MIRLAFPFTRDRYAHRLLARSSAVCLVERGDVETGSVHWEVVRLQTRHAEGSPSGRTYPAREVYPASSAWGVHGWTYTTLPEAEQKYRALVNASRNEAPAGSGECPRLTQGRGGGR